MNTFWLSFIISEAIGVAQAFIGMAGISPELKSSLGNLITSGHDVINNIHLKK